jgi:hypothetical protein
MVPPGPGRLPGHGVLSGGVLERAVTTSLATAQASRSVLAEPQLPTSGTPPCSTGRIAQGARGVAGRSMLTGTVLDRSWQSESQSSGWARAA